MKNLNIDTDQFAPKELQYFINKKKDEGLRPNEIDGKNDSELTQQIAFYRSYQDICDKGSLVDFAELLLRTHELLAHNPDLLSQPEEFLTSSLSAATIFATVSVNV